MFSINTKINTFKEKVELLTFLCYEVKARVHHFNSASWYIEIAEKTLVVIDTSCLEMNALEIDFNTTYFETNSNMSSERNEEGIQIAFAKSLEYYQNELKAGYEYPAPRVETNYATDLGDA